MDAQENPRLSVVLPQGISGETKAIVSEKKSGFLKESLDEFLKKISHGISESV